MREEVEILMKQRDAWKRRCELAEKYIALSLYGDADENDEYEAWSNWQSEVKRQEGKE